MVRATSVRLSLCAAVVAVLPGCGCGGPDDAVRIRGAISTVVDQRMLEEAAAGVAVYVTRSPTLAPEDTPDARSGDGGWYTVTKKFTDAEKRTIVGGGTVTWYVHYAKEGYRAKSFPIKIDGPRHVTIDSAMERLP